MDAIKYRNQKLKEALESSKVMSNEKLRNAVVVALEEVQSQMQEDKVA